MAGPGAGAGGAERRAPGRRGGSGRKGKPAGTGTPRGIESREGEDLARTGLGREGESAKEREKRGQGLKSTGQEERDRLRDGQRQTRIERVRQAQGRTGRDRKKGKGRKKERERERERERESEREKESTADAGLCSGSAGAAISAWPGGSPRRAGATSPPSSDTPVPGGRRRACGQGDCRVAACSPPRRRDEESPTPRPWGSAGTSALRSAGGAGEGMIDVPGNSHRHPDVSPLRLVPRAFLFPGNAG